MIGTKGLESGGGFERIIYDALKRKGLKPHQGRVVCSDAAVSTPELKRDLARDFGAKTIDMESYALFSIAYGDRTHVIFMRAVSDAVSDELPAEVGEFLDENGRVRIGKIMRFVLKHPRNISRLMGLKKRSDIAAAALTKAWRAISQIEFA